MPKPGTHRAEDAMRATRDPHLRDGEPHVGSGRDPRDARKKSSGGADRGQEPSSVEEASEE